MFMNSKTTVAFYHFIYEILQLALIVCVCVCVCVYACYLPTLQVGEYKELRFQKVPNFKRSHSWQSHIPLKFTELQQKSSPKFKGIRNATVSHNTGLNIFYLYFSQPAFLSVLQTEVVCDHGLKKNFPSNCQYISSVFILR